MSYGACNCCEEPPCGDGLWLRITSPCHYAAYDGSGTYYLRESATYVLSGTGPLSGCSETFALEYTYDPETNTCATGDPEFETDGPCGGQSPGDICDWEANLVSETATERVYTCVSGSYTLTVTFTLSVPGVAPARIIEHSPSGTCYLKVWLTDDDDTDYAYEWTGSGNPCLADPTKSFDADENLIALDISELLTGANPVVLKYSCVPGYEPDISDPGNPQPNGFPDLEWVAAP